MPIITGYLIEAEITLRVVDQRTGNELESITVQQSSFAGSDPRTDPTITQVAISLTNQLSDRAVAHAQVAQSNEKRRLA